MQAKEHIICRIASSEDRINATGLPPYISILQRVYELKTSMEVSLQRQEENVGRVIEGIAKDLEDRAIGARTVTRDGLKEMLLQTLQNAGLMRAVERLENPIAAPASPVINRNVQGQMYMWGGRLARLPEDFVFPSGSVRIAWQHWCCGNTSKGYPPLRLIKPRDIALEKVKRRLADYRFLMKRIQDSIEDDQFRIEDITITEANSLFDRYSHIAELPNLTSNNRTRRNNQLAWITVATELRKQRNQLNDQ
jgi:hypothetical protein